MTNAMLESPKISSLVMVKYDLLMQQIFIEHTGQTPTF